MHPRRRAIIRLSSGLKGLRPGHWVSGLASQLSLIANTLQQGELHNAVQNLAGRVIRKGVAEAAPGTDPVLGSAASARAPQPLTTAFRNALAVDGAALVDLDGTFQKNTKGRDVSLLIKAVIAMARDIATAVDSAGLLPQAEEALAQVEE